MMSLRLPLLALLVLALAPDVHAADGAEAAYREAQKEFWELKRSAERQKFRHHWRNTAERFEAVATRFPRSDRAPDALYTAGTLLVDLGRISHLDEDLNDAARLLQRLVERHPRDRLADDGAYALARLYLERRGERERARDVLTRMLKAQPSGDMAGKLRALLATLPGPKPAAPPAVVRAPRREAHEEKREPARPAPRVAERTRVEARETAPAPSERAGAKGGEARAEAEPEALDVEDAEDVEALAERQAAARPGASAAIPRAKSSSARVAESVQRQARRVVASTTLPGARPVATPPEAPVIGDEEEDAPAQVALADGPLVEAAARGEPAAPAEAAAPAKGGLKGPGKALVDAVARFAREDVPRVFEDPATARAREEAARRRLKAAAAANRRAELTLAEQLGLKVRRVIIDAGHGGHDTGAIGRKGTREKDVALGIATKLAVLLEEKGLEVVLTRDDDRYLKLEERSRIANAARGDLFISIHCNSAVNRKAHGVETYTLNIASDRYSIRLAARENASSEKGMSDLQFILADLATKANTEESTRLARAVQSSLVGELSRRYSNIRDLGHKEALFFVLLGAKMPAILVETAFLSNPVEEARLASPAYQRDVARAIAVGVEEFLGNRSRVARVR